MFITIKRLTYSYNIKKCQAKKQPLLVCDSNACIKAPAHARWSLLPVSGFDAFRYFELSQIIASLYFKYF